MNHQGLLWNVHCVATVVLRKQLNFKSAVIRSNRSSCFLSVTRPKFPLYQILNHATCDVYLPKAVETLIQGQCYGYCFLYLCIIYIFSFGFIEALDSKENNIYA